MKQIIVSGGGGFGRRNAPRLLEAYILAQTHKKNPSICFLPQASNEDPLYIVRFLETFHALGARTSWISLFGNVDMATVQQKIAHADIVYVGGGNTRSMLALWREWGIDTLLAAAYERGTVMAGVSAGMICWFEEGITDSVQPLGSLQALGLLKGSCCPHFDSEPDRKPTYLAKTADGLVQAGIALEDDAAAHFINGQLHQVVTTKAHKKAYYVERGSLRELSTVYIGESVI